MGRGAADRVVPVGSAYSNAQAEIIPPATITVDDFADVPQAMRDARRWLVWKYVPHMDAAKKSRKVPFYIDGSPRRGDLDSAEDRARFGTLEQAVEALQGGKYAGLGFALGPDGSGGDWQGIDLDDLPRRPELADLALPGYTEDSPSGKGRHAIGYGRPFATLGSNDSGIEAYSRGRFFTVTGSGVGLGDIACLAGYVECELRPRHSPQPARPALVADTATVELTDEQLVDLRSALSALPADDRSVWVNSGHALKPLGEVGRTLWLEFSARSNKFDPKADPLQWETFNPTRIGHRWVFAEAQRRGWKNPQRAPLRAGGRKPEDIDTAEGAEEDSPERQGDDTDSSKRGPSQATRLVQFAIQHADLFPDRNGAVFADVGEVMPVGSQRFRDWLAGQFFARNQQSARDASIREAISTLSGTTRTQVPRRDVFVRVGLHDGRYLLDLGEPGCVAVEAGRYSIIKPPVAFYRPDSFESLPTPVEGDIDDLWKLVAVPEQSRLLTIALLVEAMRIDTPFPLLELVGEQGTGKSVATAMLRRLIDPSTCDLRAVPRGPDDLFVSAQSAHCITFENVSHLPSPMQDALCLFSTGGGYARRKLYSDADEIVLTAKRPVFINGVAPVVTQQDLVDRTVTIELPAVTTRVEGTELWSRYELARPGILGALLVIASEALAALTSVRIPERRLPRLAEFARIGEAIALVMGRPAGTFLDEFQAHRGDAIARTLDASPVAVALQDWSKDHDSSSMTAGAWFETLNKYRPAGSDSWPRSAKGLADALRRAAPALRQLGLDVQSEGRRGGSVFWRVARGAGNAK